MVITVTVVSVISVDGTETSGQNKLELITRQVKDSRDKLQDKIRAIGNSKKGKKIKDWGKKFQSKLGGSKKHDTNEKTSTVWNKLRSSFKKSDRRKRSIGTQTKQILDSLKTNFKNMKTMLKGVKSTNDANNKLKSVTGEVKKLLSQKRGVTKVDALKNSLRSSKNKVDTLKDLGKAKLSLAKSKGDETLKALKESDSLKKLKEKLPTSSSDKLRQLTQSSPVGQVTHQANLFKKRISSLSSSGVSKGSSG